MTKTSLTREQVEHQLKLTTILDNHLKVMEIHLKGVQGARFRKTLMRHIVDQLFIVRRLQIYWEDRLANI